MDASNHGEVTRRLFSSLRLCWMASLVLLALGCQTSAVDRPRHLDATVIRLGDALFEVQLTNRGDSPIRITERWTGPGGLADSPLPDGADFRLRTEVDLASGVGKPVDITVVHRELLTPSSRSPAAWIELSPGQTRSITIDFSTDYIVARVADRAFWPDDGAALNANVLLRYSPVVDFSVPYLMEGSDAAISLPLRWTTGDGPHPMLVLVAPMGYRGPVLFRTSSTGLEWRYPGSEGARPVVRIPDDGVLVLRPPNPAHWWLFVQVKYEDGTRIMPGREVRPDVVAWRPVAPAPASPPGVFRYFIGTLDDVMSFRKRWHDEALSTGTGATVEQH